jgi:hypothetical protein
MLFSIIFVLLSRSSAVLLNQATQANDNVEEESCKQAVQKSSDASADDAREKSSEKIKIASTIKVTNKNKEKQREIRVTLERKDELLTSQITSVKRKAKIEALKEKEHKKIKLSITSQSCECVKVINE